jgi:hypothetical protein
MPGRDVHAVANGEDADQAAEPSDERVARAAVDDCECPPTSRKTVQATSAGPW